MNKDILISWADDLLEIDQLLDEHNHVIVQGQDAGDWKMSVFFEKSECGFAACAFGWAVQRGVFKPLELDLQIVSIDASPRHLACKSMKTWEWFGSDSLAQALGVSDKVMDMIVLPDLYPDKDNIRPADVAARISTLVDDGEDAFCEKYDRGSKD